jgi:hypothetical protein
MAGLPFDALGDDIGGDPCRVVSDVNRDGAITSWSARNRNDP